MKNSNGLFDNAARLASRLTVLALMLLCCTPFTVLGQYDNSPNAYFSAPDWAAQWKTYKETYADTNANTLNFSTVRETDPNSNPAILHFHGSYPSSVADNQHLVIEDLTVNAVASYVFDFHGNPNANSLTLVIPYGIPVTNSSFEFNNMVFNLDAGSIGIITSMTNSELRVANTIFSFSGSNNCAVLVPRMEGLGSQPNTITIDADTQFDLGYGGNNIAIAIGTNDTTLNIGANLTLYGDGDRGIWIEGGNNILNGVVIGVEGQNGGYYGTRLQMSNTDNVAIGILSDNSAAAARAAGVNVFSNLNITARGGTIGVKNDNASGGAGGQYDEETGEMLPGGGSSLEIRASTIVVGPGSIGIWNNGTLLVDGTTITATGNGIGIRNGYNDSFWIDPDAEANPVTPPADGEAAPEAPELPQYNYDYNNTAVLAVTGEWLEDGSSSSSIRVVSGPAIDNYGVLTVTGTMIIGTGANSVGIRDESVTRVNPKDGDSESDEWYYNGYQNYYYSYGDGYGYYYGSLSESARPLTVEDSVIRVNGVGISLEMNKFKNGSTDGYPLTDFRALFAPNSGNGESVGTGLTNYNDPDYINSLRQIEISGTQIFAGYTKSDGTLSVDTYGDPDAPGYNLLDHLLAVNSAGTGIEFQGNNNRFLIDSGSLIVASGYGIADAPTTVYAGEGDDMHYAGSYSGVYNRIDLAGKIIAGRSGSQRVIANKDPETGRVLVNLSDPESADFQKYVVVNPLNGWQSPALDPATGLPYIEPITGLPYVKAEAINAEGYGLHLTGDSLGWGVEPDAWSTYFGPVVSKLTVLGDDALLTGGRAAVQIGNPVYYSSSSGTSYSSEYETTHLAQITTGRNSEVADLKAFIEDGKTRKEDLRANYDFIANSLSKAERKTLFSFVDDSGIAGNIVSHYNGAVGVWEGNSESAELFPMPYAAATRFWSRTSADGGWSHYIDEIIGTTTIEGSKSYLLGHRDATPVPDGDNVSPSWWTMANGDNASIPGRSVILDEILLEWGYASVTPVPSPVTDGEAAAEETAEESAGGVDPAAIAAGPDMETVEDNLHFRDARDRMLAAWPADDAWMIDLTGLTRAQILEGITRDGTLLQFQNDIYTGTIWGGGYGAVNKPNDVGTGSARQGNIDVVIGSSNSDVQTTIFNGVTAYVRNFTVSNTGHLLMNDTSVIADSFAGGDAKRLVIHDVYNEGWVSGNGSFELSKRSNGYAGYFVNDGVLSPGLPGYIGTGTDYNSATLVDGGQFGEIKFYGSLHLSHIEQPGTTAIEKSGILEMTVGNTTLGDLLAYYSQTEPPANWRTVDSGSFPDETARQAAWETVCQEQTATRAAWIDPAGWAALHRAPEVLVQLTELLSRYGISDVLDVHRLNATDPAATRFGGTLKVDNIWENREVADNDKKHSFIIAASDAYDGSSNFANVVSDTMDIYYSNVSILPTPLATGQKAAVLTVIDDEHYYEHRVGNPYNAVQVGKALDEAMFSNPGLAQSMSFDLNSPEVLRNVFRQLAASTRANSVMMNLWSPTDMVFNQIGYGQGGLSTGSRGNVVFRDMRTNRMTQPYGQPAVPPPDGRYAAPNGQSGVVSQPQYGVRGQSPMYRSGSVWGNFMHSSFAMGDDGNAFKYSFDRNGVIAGMEWNLTPSMVWGYTAAAGYGTLRELWDKTTSSDYDLGLYLVAAPYEQFELKTFFGAGYQQYQNNRYLRNEQVHITNQESLFGLNDHYTSQTDGYSFNYALELARPFTVSPNFVIRPTAGFEIQVMKQNAYNESADRTTWNNSGNNIANDVLGETSGTYALNFRKMQFARSLSRLGFTTESYFARGGWQSRAFFVSRFTGDDYPVSVQTFQSGSIPFSIRGSDLGKSYGQLGLGTHFWLNRERTATLYFDGDYGFSLGSDGGYSLLNIGMGIQQNF
ncbi:MAG: autotransporter outer membrane beta-barrel domain-containing protein [Planctomycetaceae bacterium]|nr:autotransporter outer membrane beta-barrel domain-containing protein [Planctomycetaceae bacterium]